MPEVLPSLQTHGHWLGSSGLTASLVCKDGFHFNFNDAGFLLEVMKFHLKFKKK